MLINESNTCVIKMSASWGTIFCWVFFLFFMGYHWSRPTLSIGRKPRNTSYHVFGRRWGTINPSMITFSGSDPRGTMSCRMQGLFHLSTLPSVCLPICPYASSQANPKPPNYAMTLRLWPPGQCPQIRGPQIRWYRWPNIVLVCRFHFIRLKAVIS